MLNLRVTFGASRTSHSFSFVHFISLIQKNAQSSRHFVPLEPRIILLFTSFVQAVSFLLIISRRAESSAATARRPLIICGIFDAVSITASTAVCFFDGRMNGIARRMSSCRRTFRSSRNYQKKRHGLILSLVKKNARFERREAARRLSTF